MQCSWLINLKFEYYCEQKSLDLKTGTFHTPVGSYFLLVYSWVDIIADDCSELL